MAEQNVNAVTLLAHLTEIVEERNTLRRQQADLAEQLSRYQQVTAQVTGEVADLLAVLREVGCPALEAPPARIVPAATALIRRQQERLAELAAERERLTPPAGESIPV